MASARRVLIIEDDQRIAQLVQRVLEREGFEVDLAGDGPSGLDAASSGQYAAVVLDVRLPGMDGFEIVRTMRERDLWVPVLMLTGRSGVADRVKGLSAGADDYLPKPFAVQELSARIQALTRRGRDDAREMTVLKVDDLHMDLLRREVTRSGTPVDLSPREFDLLELLMRNAGRVMSRRTLFAGVWGHQLEQSSNVVDVYVRYVRDKIDRPFGRDSIETVRGAGYRLRTDPGDQ